MSARLTLSALALAAVVCALVAAPVSVASAAPTRAVPDGETLYGISCNWASNEHGLQVLAIDGESADAVTIGDSGHPVYWCALAMSWDRVAASCTVYTMARGGDEQPALLRTDLSTGTSTVVAPLTIDGYTQWIGSFTIDGTGAAWATWNDSVYSVDLTTGVLTLVAALDVSGLGYLTWSSFDNSFYATDYSTVYRVDPNSGHATALGTVALPGGGTLLIEGMTIDSQGTFWFSRLEPADYEYPGEWVRQLVSASPNLSGAQLAGRYSTVDGEVPVVALLSLPAEAECGFDLPTLALPDPATPSTPVALAATGSEDPTIMIALALALATVAAGAGLIVAAARRARRR